MNFLKLEAVKAKTALGRSTIYKFMAEGRFPQSISLGPRAVAWDEEEIDQWMQERLQKRDERIAAQSAPVKSVA